MELDVIVKSVTIGTAATCDVRINNDQYVSPRHARIDLHDTGVFTVMDLGSTNGTWVDGRRVPLGSSGLLRAGETIRVGRTDMPWNVEAPWI